VISGTVRALDFGAILIAGVVAHWIYLGAPTGGLEEDFDRYVTTTLLVAILFVFGFGRARGYEFQRLGKRRRQISRVAVAWLITLAAMIVFAYLGKVSTVYSRGWTITWATSSLAAMTFVRLVVATTLRRWAMQGRLSRKIAVVGAGRVAERLIAKLLAARDERVVIAGVFDDRSSRIPATVAGCRVLGTTDDLVSFVRSSAVDEVIIALPLRAVERIGHLIGKLRSLPVDLRLSMEPLAEAFPICGISRTGSVPLIEIMDRPLKHWSAVAKWLEDKLLSATLLLALSPLMGLVALLIKLDSKGPVLFVQMRFGFNNEPISVYKFRTMYVERGDSSGARRTMKDDPRVTRIGRFLRGLSLDELPQLFNVLTGDMSIVGPRAHAMAMRAGDKLYHDAVGEYFERHRVRPGITGWAQVNGLRGEIDTLERARERVAYDLEYIDKWSLWLDLKIILQTTKVVVTRQNAY
jgi:Undecaprenyl-phosphate glucose phosphotransferase